MTTTELIRPAIWEIYGRSFMAEALVDHLGAKIDADDWDSRGREYGIMIVCWDWFSGGGTAAIAARNIEEALVARDS